MRPRVLPFSSSLPRIVRRAYSAKTESLIKVSLFKHCSEQLSSIRPLRPGQSTRSTPLRIAQLPNPTQPYTGPTDILRSTTSKPPTAARNAISRQLLNELRQNIDSVSSEYTSDGSEAPPKKIYGGAAGVDERGPTRVLILASDVDSSFCAGADLKERAGFTADEYVEASPQIFAKREKQVDSTIEDCADVCGSI